MPDLYYIQDTRQCVGNSALWWREDGGYTCDLRQAWKVNRVIRGDATSLFENGVALPFSLRYADILRLCSEMDALAELHVDVQKLTRTYERETSI